MPPVDPYIQIAPGKRFYFEVSDPGTPEEIASGLAGTFRFNGRGCTVAEHSVLVSLIVPVRYAFIGLMHDAHEHIVGDMSSPLKGRIPEFRGPEALAWYAMCQKYGLPFANPPAVKRADFACMIVEAEARGFDTSARAGRSDFTELPEIEVKFLPPEAAEKLWLDRFYQLTEENWQAVPELESGKKCALKKIQSLEHEISVFRQLTKPCTWSDSQRAAWACTATVASGFNELVRVSFADAEKSEP